MTNNEFYHSSNDDSFYIPDKVVKCAGTNSKGRSVLFKWNSKVKSSTPKKLKLLHHSNSLIKTIIKR